MRRQRLHIDPCPSKIILFYWSCKVYCFVWDMHCFLCEAQNIKRKFASFDLLPRAGTPDPRKGGFVAFVPISY